MGWPQITMIALMSVSIGINLVKHGERRPDYNVWHALMGTSISCWLLYAGGFFRFPA